MKKNKLCVYEIKALDGIDFEEIIKTLHENIIDPQPIRISYYQSDALTLMVLSDGIDMDQLKNIYFNMAKVEKVMEV